METIVQVVTMKSLAPALLAVLLLAGCAVNKPLPVEAVKLAGMEFYPIDASAGYGLKCNTFSEKYKFKLVCLANDQFIADKVFDGVMTIQENRQAYVENYMQAMVSSFSKRGKPVLLDSTNLLVFKSNTTDDYFVVKIFQFSSYIIVVRYTGPDYEKQLPTINRIIDGLKEYRPLLGGK